jgi:hypothetical protein
MSKCVDVLELHTLENVSNQAFEKFLKYMITGFAKLQDQGGSHSFHLNEDSVSESKMTIIERFSENSEKIEPSTPIESHGAQRSNIYLRRSTRNLIHHYLNNAAQFF